MRFDDAESDAVDQEIISNLAEVAAEEIPTTQPGIISSKTYDVLKKTVQFVLPAIGALYFALSQIWGLPAGEEVVGTVAALTVFFSAVLGVSNRAYKNDDARFDGVIAVSPNDNVAAMKLDGRPVSDWADKESITIKVKNVD